MSEHWGRIDALAPDPSCPAGATVTDASRAYVGAAAGIAGRG